MQAIWLLFLTAKICLLQRRDRTLRAFVWPSGSSKDKPLETLVKGGLTLPVHGPTLILGRQTAAPMSRRLSVAVFLLLCFTTEAGAGPWQVRPVPATLPADENRASGQDESIGSAADYIQTLNRAVTIPRIGMSV